MFFETKPAPKKRKKKRVPTKPRYNGGPPKALGNAHLPTRKTREAVLEAVRHGLTQPQIAKFMGISVSCLTKRYRDELNKGEVDMLLKVSQNLHQIALSTEHKSAAAAAMFIMKTRAGWRETNRTELTGANGAPLEVSSQRGIIDPRQLSAPAREELRLLIQSTMDKIEAADEDSDDIVDAEYEEVDQDDDSVETDDED